MNIAIWIIQGILAIMFGMAGVMKATQSKQKLAPQVPWVKDFPLVVVKIIGIAEVLGAIGLIVPMLTGILPVLTPVAAISLATIMLLAMIYHLSKSEYKETGFNLVLFSLSVVVVYYRFLGT